MKEPIKPEDIREGDLIRREPTPTGGSSLRAVEYVAVRDGYTHGLRDSSDTDIFFLLDRPTPAVDLPTSPSLGTLVWREESAVRDAMETALWGLTRRGDRVESESSSVPVRLVTQFIPILTHEADEVAVPKAALDELRAAEIHAWVAIATFIAAVDAANGDPR